jgi:ribosomal-protein-alanine acetyltransferase
MLAADLAGVLALEAENPSAWSAAQLAAELAGEAGWQFVAVSGGQGETLCGFVCGRTVAGEAEILRLAVAGPWRRQGVAAGLLAHSFDLLARQDVGRIFLEVRAANAPARSLYEKLGFRQVGLRKNYYASPMDHAVVMAREVSARHSDITKEKGEGASFEKHQGP